MIRRSVRLACGVALIAMATPLGAQVAAPAAPLTPAQMETFLLKAAVIAERSAGAGTTESRRLTLTDGTLTHDAHVQVVDTQRSEQSVNRTPVSMLNDAYRYNIAAYRLASLLGMDNVPVSVERSINGRSAAVTWWIDNVQFDEGGRMKLPPERRLGPAAVRTAQQLARMHLFDELIKNRDRNQGNAIWSTDWKLWLIDHTRAFGLDDQIDTEEMAGCDRALWEKLQTLQRADVAAAVGRTLNDWEIDALLKRRDAIVRYLKARIAERGESIVLFTLQ